jgi:hypothetical protein
VGERTGTKPLARGRQFHLDVQGAFLTDLLGATAKDEKPVTLSSTRNGRVDLLVLPSSGEVAAVIVEIKSTDWDTLAGHRVRPNLRSHVRQLQRYLDTFVEDLRQDGRAATGRWDSVSGVLLYPRRPADPARLQLVEEVATREALMVVWYDETPWKAERLTRDVR